MVPNSIPIRNVSTPGRWPVELVSHKTMIGVKIFVQEKALYYVSGHFIRVLNKSGKRFYTIEAFLVFSMVISHMYGGIMVR